MYFEGVLFLVFTKEIKHIQAIDLSLSEQSQFFKRNIKIRPNYFL